MSATDVCIHCDHTRAKHWRGIPGLSAANDPSVIVDEHHLSCAQILNLDGHPDDVADVCPCPRFEDMAATGDDDPLRTFSYGGGVQSTAALVLAAQRKINFPIFLMANVGNDSEDPLTLEYVETYAKPYAARNGIELHVIDRVRRDGAVETVYGRITKPGAKSHVIPVRLSNGAPGGRSCTADFKIRVVGKWLKAHGATEQNKAVVGIGISLDEIERINARKAEPHEKTVYPLIGIGEETGLKLNRDGCGRIILDAGLPLPPKSSCWFCPFHRPSTWAEMRRDRPELFEKACQLEDHLNNRQREDGKDPVWLTRFNRPLRMLPVAQDYLPGLDHVDLDDAECDNGVCFV